MLISAIDLPFLLANGFVDIAIGSQAAVSVLMLLLMIAVGLAAITKGGDMFTDSSADIATMTRIPPVIVGATIVSAATSFPEFMVSLTGTLSGSAEFAVGNAIGSCLCNIGLIVGVCAVVRGFLAKRRNIEPGIIANRDMLAGAGSFMLVTAVLVWGLSLFDAGGAMMGDQVSRFGLSRWQASILIVLMFLYLGYSVRNARQARFEDALNNTDKTTPSGGSLKQWIRTIAMFIAATAMVVIGSRLLVCNGEELALRMGVPKLVLALTLFAVGTSLPELTISLIAVLKGHEALGIGNVIGSNVLNICWVLATCAAVKPLPIAGQTVAVDLPMNLVLSILLIALPWRQQRISTRHGWIILGLYMAYMVGISVAGMNAASSQ